MESHYAREVAAGLKATAKNVLPTDLKRKHMRFLTAEALKAAECLFACADEIDRLGGNDGKVC